MRRERRAVPVIRGALPRRCFPDKRADAVQAGNKEWKCNEGTSSSTYTDPRPSPSAPDRHDGLVELCRPLLDDRDSPGQRLGDQRVQYDASGLGAGIPSNWIS